MTTIRKVIGRLPVVIGEWDANYREGQGYKKNNRVLIFNSELQSKIDDNVYAPATQAQTGEISFDTTHWTIIHDGRDTIGLNEKLSEKANVADLATVATSGSYNDLSNKPDTIEGYGITDAYTKSEVYNKEETNTELAKKQDTISDLSTIRENANKGATAYQKPTGGIPKSDLASSVQESLDKADTALQNHQDISGKADKTQVATDIAAAVKTEADRAKSAESTLSAQIATLQRGVAGGVGFVISMDDTIKVLSLIGTEAQLAAFNNWVDNSPRPCEVKKDFTDFAYLLNTAGAASSTNWLKRADGETDSHYNSDDKEDYLQLVEFENVNFGFFADNVLRTITVMFNFDKNCPAGFHRWFKEDTKLHARYDTTFNVTKGIDCCIGKNFTGRYSTDVGYQKNKDTNENLMEWTAWEYAVYTWIMCMYYRGFDSQTLLGSGINGGGQSAAEAFVNGLTDSLTTPHGKVAATGGEAIRFMYIENPYGLRWIWCAGWRGDLTVGKWTRDDEKANAANIVAAADCEETHAILAFSQNYAKNVNILGILSEKGGSSTSGFYDGNWSNINTKDRILFVGGASYVGVVDGVLARTVDLAVSDSGWDRRGRCAVRKSAVVSA